jgi:hypothetical protein
MPKDATLPRDRRAILDDICERMAEGKSVARILGDGRRPKDFPSLSAFWRWLTDDDDLKKLYEFALQVRAERQAEEINEIADSLVGRKKLNPQQLRLAQLRCDNRKWTASRLLPKKYGDRVTLAGDAASPLAVDVVDARAALLGRLGPPAGSTGAAGPDREPDR